MANRRRRLIALNDPRLSAYLAASEEESRADELGKLLSDVVLPRVRLVLKGYAAHSGIDDANFDDIAGQVMLRILRKLRAASALEEESIQNIEAYVVTLTRNAWRDFMRRRSPERTRIQSKLRYMFAHDERLALWTENGAAICGLAEWRQAGLRESDPSAVLAAVSEIAASGHLSFAEIPALLAHVGSPVRFAVLTAALMEGQPDADANGPHHGVLAPPQRDAAEARQYLRILWDEIRALPPRQRVALLLNLREPGSGNAVALLLAVGIATIEDVAAAMEMALDDLIRIWDGLPLTDHEIASHLDINRQQVINLRKSARERLTRRMILRAGLRQ